MESLQIGVPHEKEVPSIEKFGHTHILKNIVAGLIKNTSIEHEGPHTVKAPNSTALTMFIQNRSLSRKVNKNLTKICLGWKRCQ